MSIEKPDPKFVKEMQDILFWQIGKEQAGRRYLVFAGDHYYPEGGWSDFRDSFATLEEAKKRAEELCGLPDGLPWPANRNWDWAHIVDLFHPEQKPLAWSKAHAMKERES